MARIVHNQTNFTAGELSPRMKGRGDVARYQNGAETIENGIVAVHGGVRRRSGTRFLAVAKLEGARRVRLIRYVFAVEQAYILEVGHGYVRIFDGNTGAVILDPATGLPLEVASPYVEDQLLELRTKQSADVMYLYHSAVPTHQLQRLTPTQWVLRPVRWVIEPFAEIGHTPDARLQLSDPNPGPGRSFTTSAVSLPGAPTGVSAQAFNGAARVSFNPPASDGGGSVTSYTVTASPGGATATGVGSPLMVQGLANGTAYTFTVTATNKLGAGPASAASAPVTPSGSLPGGALTVTSRDMSVTARNGFDNVGGPSATAAGGTPPYRVNWSVLSGSPNIYVDLPSSNPVGLVSEGYGSTNTARLRVVAVDANGATGFVDVNVTVRHVTGSGGGNQVIQ